MKSKVMVDYVNNVEKILKNKSYSENQITDILNRIMDPYEKIDPIAKIRGYKSLKQIYLPHVNRSDMFYYNINTHVKALSIKLGETTYAVAFSFLNPRNAVDDINSLMVRNEWKKFPLINYIKDRFKYTVDATTHINAICLAYNGHLKDFPSGKRRSEKIHPQINFIRPQLNHVYSDFDKIPETPPYFKKPGFEYYKQKQYLKSIVDLKNVRYYISPYISCNNNPGVSAMVVKDKNSFTVTFAFLSKDDKNYIDTAYQSNILSDNDLVNATKISLINNKKNNKYTYTLTDTKNSISSVVRAFNENRRSFPSIYKKFKVKLDIAQDTQF